MPLRVAQSPPACPPDPAVDAPPTTPRRLSSRELFAGAREVEIEHEGMLYRLRRTSLGKLILTK
ncbi:MAG: hemin uptake protein HemP [Burkholderiaceae bacterium]|nr:hemin uptake protein HemP [Burkholderiaceae bacterium]